MAVAKTKEPPEEKIEEPDKPADESEPVTKANLRSLLEELIPELLKGEPETEDKGVPAKRETAKDEEQRTYADVMDAIKEFKASLKGEEKTTEKTAEPEKVPGSVTVRKIEKLLWGKE